MEPHKGDKIGGFTVLKVRPVREYKSIGYLLEHDKSGCSLYHLHNEDAENFFSFIFKTPPSDNRGTSHIIEHSVLSGSRAFPLKDPFISLMKGSMNTFLNAMTYPDKTAYPASSTVEADYFNLMRVYGDAVFFPLLKREVFLQEGRRIELDKNGNPNIEGVVYNEMMGNYSSHDSIVGEWSYRSLFPDSVYRFDSGGDPVEIRDLSYGQFLDFHKTWYHPANCQVFLYGNIPTAKSLEFIDTHFLQFFERQKVNSDIELQPRWTTPVYMTKTSPVSTEEETGEGTTVSVNWIGPSIKDPYMVLSMEVLAEILLGNPGAPLHRSIVESGLGEDLSPVSGLDTDTLELVFSFGIRGTHEDKAQEFEKLVLGELEALATKGISDEVVSGALKRVEFRNREIKGGSPFGLRLMGKLFRGWLHGCEPETTLEFSPWMEKLKKEKKGYFEDLIRKALLDNLHRSTVVVIPDKNHEANVAEDLENWKRSFLDSAGPEVLIQLQDDKERLALFQNAPDPPDVVVPSLTLDDVPRQIDTIDTKLEDLNGMPLHSLEIFTNGVVYVDFAFDVQDIDDGLLQYLPFFCRMVCGAGLPGKRYDQVSRQLTLLTGGFISYLEANSMVGTQNSRSLIIFRIKLLEDDFAAGLDLVVSLIKSADFLDFDRIRDVLLELRNDYRSQLLPAGSSFAALRAGSSISGVFAREELWKGIDQAFFLTEIADNIEKKVHDLAGIIEKIRKQLLNRSRLHINIAADDTFLDTAKKGVAQHLADLPQTGPVEAFSVLATPERRTPGVEALIVPSQISFSASMAEGSPFESTQHAHEVLLAHLLKTGFLWEEVRMKGGAYGVSASANGGECLFSFSSYRDPRIVETLDAFRRGLAFFAKERVDKTDLEKAIISIVGRDVRPMSPSEKSIVGFRRKLYGIDDQLRQSKRDELLRAQTSDIMRAATRLSESFQSAVSVVMAGNEATLTAQKQDHDIGSPMTVIPY